MCVPFSLFLSLSLSVSLSLSLSFVWFLSSVPPHRQQARWKETIKWLCMICLDSGPRLSLSPSFMIQLNIILPAIKEGSEREGEIHIPSLISHCIALKKRIDTNNNSNALFVSHFSNLFIPNSAIFFIYGRGRL